MFVPLEKYDSEVSIVCTNCEEQYLSLPWGYCDETLGCTGADLYVPATGEYLEV